MQPSAADLAKDTASTVDDGGADADHGAVVELGVALLDVLTLARDLLVLGKQVVARDPHLVKPQEAIVLAAGLTARE